MLTLYYKITKKLGSMMQKVYGFLKGIAKIKNALFNYLITLDRLYFFSNII